MIIKQCHRCREAKPVSEFYQVKTGDGYSSKCKKCSCMYQLDWTIKNEEHVKAYRKEYARTHKRKQKSRKKPEVPVPNGFVPIENYPNYFISKDSDRVWSKKKGRFLALIKINHGYYAARVHNEEGSKMFLIHRLLASAFIPNPENKPCVNHKNGKKLENFLENLEWCSYQENIQHAISMGLIPPKEKGKPRKARLTKDQVLEIKNNPDRLTQAQLAEKLGVLKQVVYGVCQGRTYKNIQ